MADKIKIQSASSVAGKETIYVDVDDEITAIIDKVSVAKGKVIALVLPKRCAVLQSIVNMKLLKRTADTAGKNLVLVTSEAGLMPLAGTVGLFVASTPTSKPSIPPTPAVISDEPEDIDEPLNIVDGTADADDFDKKAAAGTAVGELAASKVDADDIDESIDMGDDEPAPVAAAPVAKTKKDRKLKVPNFDSFRKKLALGIAVLVLLIAGWIFAVVVLPKATITIKTDSSSIPTNVNLVLNANATKLDSVNGVVPATVQSQQKTDTQQVPATGQQNNGQKASGQVTFTLTDCNHATVTIPTGSGVSSNGHTYITQSSVTLSSVTVGGRCNPSSFSSIYSAAATVVALKGGADYNEANGASFSVSSSISGASSVSAQASSDISGGTDDIVKIVAQSDIDGATSKITAENSDSVKQQLVSNLQSKGLQPVAATFSAGKPQVTTSAKAGDQADTVTVTSVTAYTMFGVHKSDLKTIVDNNVNGQLDKGKQVILDDGVANAQFTETSPASATTVNVTMHTKSQAGPQLDAAALKTALAGKKAGDVRSYIKATPGVTDVQVHFSPFWVNTVPGKASKVQIHITKAD